MVWAVKDPTSGNLDRIQIVKGWTKNGQSFEKIYDVVWSGDRKPDKWTGRIPPIESTVDIDNATYTNTVGSVELKTVWTDPDFDPSLHAFYYARVLEIPTPRWTTIQAHATRHRAAGCRAGNGAGTRLEFADLVHAERRRAQGRSAGLTVAALTQKGGVALDEAQLKDAARRQGRLGAQHRDGRAVQGQLQRERAAIVLHVGRNATVPSLAGDVAQNGYQGVTTPYSIANGKVVTTLSQAPIEVTVYKMGDTYYAARSNEFGYANYEILPKPPLFLHPLGKGEVAGSGADTHPAPEQK